MDNSLLIKLRASVAGCWTKSASEAFSEAATLVQLSVRLLLNGRSGEVLDSEVTEASLTCPGWLFVGMLGA